jgi:hypothetical protein
LVFCFSLIFFYYFGWSHSLRSPIKGRNKQLMGSHKMEISARPSHLLISYFFFSLLLFHSWWLIRFSSSVIKSLRAFRSVLLWLARSQTKFCYHWIHLLEILKAFLIRDIP